MLMAANPASPFMFVKTKRYVPGGGSNFVGLVGEEQALLRIAWDMSEKVKTMTPMAGSFMALRISTPQAQVSGEVQDLYRVSTSAHSRCAFRQFDQDNIGILPRPIEHDVPAVGRNVEGSQRALIAETRHGTRFSGREI